MFEAFTPEAERAVIGAAETSRQLGDDMIRSEHLLLGALVAGLGQRSVGLLVAAGLEPERVAPELRDFLGPSATKELATLGIDLGEVRSRLEAVFGSDALRDAGPRWPSIPFSSHAKAAMNQTVREARERGREKVDVADVLCAVLHPGLSDAQHEGVSASYAAMARREGLYEGEKGARRVVRALGADPDALLERLRDL